MPDDLLLAGFDTAQTGSYLANYLRVTLNSDGNSKVREPFADNPAGVRRDQYHLIIRETHRRPAATAHLGD